MIRVGRLSLFLVLACQAAACAVESDQPAVEAASFTVADSCGESFTVRTADGTLRLKIAAPRSAVNGSEAGTFDFEPDGWTGRLEVGSGLEVWPCHDIASDFDGEQVREVWPITSGSIELLDAIVPDVSGGGGSDPVDAVLHEVVVQRPDGTTVQIDDVAVSNPRWGFYGG